MGRIKDWQSKFARWGNQEFPGATFEVTLSGRIGGEIRVRIVSMVLSSFRGQESSQYLVFFSCPSFCFACFFHHTRFSRDSFKIQVVTVYDANRQRIIRVRDTRCTPIFTPISSEYATGILWVSRAVKLNEGRDEFHLASEQGEQLEDGISHGNEESAWRSDLF